MSIIARPTKLGYRDDWQPEEADTPYAAGNRAGELVFVYAAARGIDPYETPRAEVDAMIRADLDALAEREAAGQASDTRP